MTDRVALLATIQQIVAGIVGSPRASTAREDTPLAEGGLWLDSLELLQVVVACEREFGITFDPATDLLDGALATVGTLATLVDSKNPRPRPGSRAVSPATTRMRGRWRSRPSFFTRGLWGLLIALDGLPWPWGEVILARLFAVIGLVRGSRRRRALAWADAREPSRRWRLAAAVSAYRGRWVARRLLLGVRSPDDLRRHVIVEGETHLAAATGGAILLSFHLGPPLAELPLVLRGHQVRYLGWRLGPATAEWWNDAWRPILEPRRVSSAVRDRARWPAVLYDGRQTLLDGGKIGIMADGGGQELFRVPVAGRDLVVRAGWLTLQRLTGVPVLPLLTRLEGRTQIVTVQPPLPEDEPDPDRRLEVWKAIISSLVSDYVRRYPEQCPNLAFVDPEELQRGGGFERRPRRLR